MTFTPGNNVKKKRSRQHPSTAQPLTPNQISELLSIWLGKMPPDCAAIITTGAMPSAPENRSMRDEVASASTLLMHAVNYNPATWVSPKFFEQTRMGRSIAWLQALPCDQRVPARDSAVHILKNAWPSFLAGLQDPHLNLHTIPDLWTPEEEFGPLDAPAPYLPSWRVDDEDEAIRRVARASEEFSVYSLLVTWLNDLTGYPLLDFDIYPF
ncbi:hypothetical protein ACFP81_10530 [Deinococcus lacus]|uniref:Uncharacterized protein n=1 Tax=Deinococcus lacus TaxID=392561 RepID=A0ABW1YED7_9DEIO